jgi:phosphoglycerol transferase MdoB-like AlkP superfamily enzyme
MHDYTEAYYYRRTIHPNFGAEKYYGVEDLGIPYQNEYVNWASDEDFAKKAMDIVLDSGQYSDAPFMLWMTTVSSHQPYSSDSIIGRQYLNLFKDLPYNIEIKRYMSKLKNLDNSFGILMNRLEKAGELENTVFVLFGDHYPYGISNDKLQKVLQYDLSDYENERTPFTIYAPGVEGKEFDQYTSYINIAPTVANLFNLDYDPRLYMGEDILSDSYMSKVVFADGSWKNADMYYNAKNGAVKQYSDVVYSQEQIISINQEITNKMNISSSIIKSDYFNRLNTKLNELKEKKETELALIEEE